MFTGIIEEIGKIKNLIMSSGRAEITVECSKVLADSKIGDSISVNGVCQTIVNLDKNSFTADVSQETLKVTNFSELKIGDKVNLERALSLKERIGGHFVSGHVDSTAKFISSKKNEDFYDLVFEINDEIKKYIIKKGSIAINGISLTIAQIEDCRIKIAVIPHTYENTSLCDLKQGQKVNIETDIFAKYIEKFLLNEKMTSVITEDFLKANGFV